MAYARRVDGTHTDVVKALRQLFWRVHDCSRAGNGFPDLVVCRHGQIRLVEVKTATGKRTTAQERFSELFPVFLVRGVEDVVKQFA